MRQRPTPCCQLDVYPNTQGKRPAICYLHVYRDESPSSPRPRRAAPGSRLSYPRHGPTGFMDNWGCTLPPMFWRPQDAHLCCRVFFPDANLLY